ncbi:hypothetical protein Q5H91_03185 [Sphingomonas sp. KR1UV-12]|uniref:Tetratricopeptide repeat protein n=1 Tax=Sphingomonas aurea TaxID=3063994 RepID=A0ABT9EGV6_9SPHN|nr:hypothetical protein [Sphingomonas sp. KR1UV-12]MDP1026204.1 hypothetical protein [Sphingomonas sp. KR1UV-12]
MRFVSTCVLVPLLALVLPQAAPAQSVRDLLTQAAFQDRSGSVALARIDKARAAALASAKRDPDDQDSAVLAAIALGYRAKLTGDRSEAMAARRQFEQVVGRFPRNAEAQAGLGAWHLGIIAHVGRFVARAVAGARENTGLAALDRSVALGGDRAFFAGLAGLLRINYDPGDARGLQLLDTAAKAPAPTPLDRIIQKSAVAVLAPLRRGDRKGAKALADRLLPFGWFDDKDS